jgi:hypothetical protein
MMDSVEYQTGEFPTQDQVVVLHSGEVEKEVP